MAEIMKTAQILRNILNTHPGAFLDTRKLYDLFDEYSGGQFREELNQLGIFLKCRGNTRILGLRCKAGPEVEKERSCLIQEMVCDQSMEEADALNICEAFWQGVFGTQLKSEPKRLRNIETPPAASLKKPDKPAARPRWTDNVLKRNRGEWSTSKVLGSRITRDQIRSITFLDTLSAWPVGKSGVSDTWDVSEKKDGSVLAWTEKTDQNNFDLFIAGDGGVNGCYCKELFASYKNVQEIRFNGNFHTDQATDFYGMFQGCERLQSLNVSGFDTSKVTSMWRMFAGCKNLKTLDLSGFDTSKVIGMGSMFAGCKNLKTLDFSGFDTSKVIDMGSMFAGCKNLKTLDLSGFDTSKVIDMGNMFAGCKNLKTLDLSGFDTSKVIDMRSMFKTCIRLKTLDLSGFDTSNVEDMRCMFCECISLEVLDLRGFDISGVKDMYGMFDYCDNLKSLEASWLDPSEITNITSLAWSAAPLEEPGRSAARPSWVDNVLMRDRGERSTSKVLGSQISRDQIHSITFLDTLSARYTGKWNASDAWDVSEMENGSVFAWVRKVDSFDIDMPPDETYYDLFIAGDGGVNGRYCDGLFAHYENLDNIYFNGNFHTDQATSFYEMFCGCGLEELDISGLDASNVTNMEAMFCGCEWMIKLRDFRGWSNPKVTNMSRMFQGCSEIEALDLRGFGTSKVTDMSRMFEGCSEIEALDLRGFGTSKVTDMDSMFAGCINIKSLDLRGFDTSKVTDMESMFDGCKNIKTLDLRGFDTSNVMRMRYMFRGCKCLETLDVSGWTNPKVTDMAGMFEECESLKTLDLRGFGTPSATHMDWMLCNCKSLRTLDVRGFEVAKAGLRSIFSGCSSLVTLGSVPLWTGAPTESQPLPPGTVFKDIQVERRLWDYMFG